MEPVRSIGELTRRNVASIAAMERADAGLRTRGDRIADRIAAWVGSWPFILAQSTIMLLWIALNVAAWASRWDPYPFVLLNLVLSFQAAYTAPILMISQNRQARLAERRNHLDLQIDMLAEQETTEILRLLHLLCERAGVSLDRDGSGRALEEETKHAEIVRQIQGEIEEGRGESSEAAEMAATGDAAATGDRPRRRPGARGLAHDGRTGDPPAPLSAARRPATLPPTDPPGRAPRSGAPMAG